MNYDLAIMALDGLTRSPIRVATVQGEVRISGEAAGLKELARLLLLRASAAGRGAVGMSVTGDVPDATQSSSNAR